jgi:hypothetical protein
MRLYRGKIPIISEEIVDVLIQDGDIEVERDMIPEVHLDIEAVLKEFQRVDRAILEQAKDMVANRGLDFSHTYRIRKTIAERRGFGLGDQAYSWILEQLIEALLHSKNVEEVFAEDHDLRRKMREVLRKHTEMDRDLDREVRAKIRNMEEGTQNWDVEYQRVMSDIRRNKKLI